MITTIRHILEYLEEWAPQRTKLDYDNVGLLVGDSGQSVGRVAVCLDVTHEVVDEAIESGAGLIIAHHPLIFKRISRISPATPVGSLLYRLIKADVALIAVHTNLDAAYGGVSFVLAEKLGLQGIEFLDSDPASGSPEDQAIQNRTGFGAIGHLPASMDCTAFSTHVTKQLKARGIRFSGSPENIKRVAVCGGAGSFLIEKAIEQRADAFVTSDVKYHDFFYGSESFLLIDAGHYETEIPVVKTMCERLKHRFPEAEIFPSGVNSNPIRFFLDN